MKCKRMLAVMLAAVFLIAAISVPASASADTQYAGPDSASASVPELTIATGKYAINGTGVEIRATLSASGPVNATVNGGTFSVISTQTFFYDGQYWARGSITIGSNAIFGYIAVIYLDNVPELTIAEGKYTINGTGVEIRATLTAAGPVNATVNGGTFNVMVPQTFFYGGQFWAYGYTMIGTNAVFGYIPVVNLS